MQASFHRLRKQLREAGAVPKPTAKFIDVGVLPLSTPDAPAATECCVRLELRLELGDGVVLHIIAGNDAVGLALTPGQSCNHERFRLSPSKFPMNWSTEPLLDSRHGYSLR